MVALGLTALAAELAVLAPSFLHILDSARQGLLGLAPVVGLSVLQAARAIVFHQIDYFYLFPRILVLFFALAATVIGCVLLTTGSAAAAAFDHTNMPVPDKGNR
jgi:hypothetical protein